MNTKNSVRRRYIRRRKDFMKKTMVYLFACMGGLWAFLTLVGGLFNLMGI